MALIAMDACFRPAFGATVGTDVGPGTDYNIRYSKTQFESMLKRYIDNTASFRVGGPLSFEANYSYNGHGPFNLNGSGGWVGTTWNWAGTVPDGFSGGTPVSDYPGCPYVDGMGPPMEDAVINESFTVSYAFSLLLANAKVEQPFWDTYTDIWLPFTFTTAGSWTSDFQCSGGSGGSLGGGPIVSNFMGFDYTTGPTITGEDFKISIGDGFMSAYFKDPGGSDKLLFTAFETTN